MFLLVVGGFPSPGKSERDPQRRTWWLPAHRIVPASMQNSTSCARLRDGSTTPTRSPVTSPAGDDELVGRGDQHSAAGRSGRRCRGLRRSWPAGPASMPRVRGQPAVLLQFVLAVAQVAPPAGSPASASLRDSLPAYSRYPENGSHARTATACCCLSTLNRWNLRASDAAGRRAWRSPS